MILVLLLCFRPTILDDNCWRSLSGICLDHDRLTIVVILQELLKCKHLFFKLFSGLLPSRTLCLVDSAAHFRHELCHVVDIT